MCAILTCYEGVGWNYQFKDWDLIITHSKTRDSKLRSRVEYFKGKESSFGQSNWIYEISFGREVIIHIGVRRPDIFSLKCFSNQIALIEMPNIEWREN